MTNPTKTDLYALEVMIDCLKIFEEVQGSFEENFWQEMSNFLGEKWETVTWIEISNVKEALEDYQNVLKNPTTIKGANNNGPNNPL